MKKLLTILILLIAIGAIGVATLKIVFPSGKIKACKQIELGITLEEFTGKFGNPIHETEKDGELWLLFSSDALAAGPIRIRIDENTNEVLGLRCTEDGQSEWIIDNQ